MSVSRRVGSRGRELPSTLSASTDTLGDCAEFPDGFILLAPVRAYPLNETRRPLLEMFRLRGMPLPEHRFAMTQAAEQDGFELPSPANFLSKRAFSASFVFSVGAARL